MNLIDIMSGKIIKKSLRVCASCEWIFKHPKGEILACPKCGFGHYYAHYVYGDTAYRYAKTQKPWKDKKLHDYEDKLNIEIMKSVFEKL